MKDFEMWDIYCENNDIKNKSYTSWQFGEKADELAKLVIDGIKTATTSAFILYGDYEPLPKKDEYSVILDSNDEAVCIIKTIKVYLERFSSISSEYALKEGEGDKSLEYWKKVHKDFFTKELEDAGLEFDEDMIVVCEEFELVYKGDKDV